MPIDVGPRRENAERDDEAFAEIEARRDGWLDQEVALARLFARVQRKSAFLYARCSSVAEYGARRGYDGYRVLELCRLGYALDAEPELEALLKANRVTFAAACELGRLHQAPDCVEEEDTWLHWAESTRLRDLRRRVRERLEAFRNSAKKAETLTIPVTPETKESFLACRDLASGKADRQLSKGQALLAVSTFYRRHFDPTWKTPGKRRMPPTDERLFDRGVPAEVVRAIWERSAGLCEFGGCERPIQHLCHLKPHRHGSPREANDLVGGCTLDHRHLDDGHLRFLAWTGDGLPVFQVTQTNEVVSPKPLPEERERPPMPDWLRKAVGLRVRKQPLPRERPPERPTEGLVCDRSRPPGGHPGHRPQQRRRAAPYERRKAYAASAEDATSEADREPPRSHALPWRVQRPDVCRTVPRRPGSPLGTGPRAPGRKGGLNELEKRQESLHADRRAGAGRPFGPPAWARWRSAHA